MGGTWGGSWTSFVDRPHCEFTGGLTLGQLQAGGRLPDDAAMPWEDNSFNTMAQEESMRFNTVEEVPDWAQAFVQGMIDRGELSGNGQGLNITEDMIRCWMVGERQTLNTLRDRGLL
jgi:hypothetical protein